MKLKSIFKFFAYLIMLTLSLILLIILNNYLPSWMVFVTFIVIALGITYVYMKKRMADNYKRLGKKVDEKTLDKIKENEEKIKKEIKENKDKIKEDVESNNEHSNKDI